MTPRTIQKCPGTIVYVKCQQEKLPVYVGNHGDGSTEEVKSTLNAQAAENTGTEKGITPRTQNR